jgi:hypothetical protein
MWLCSTTNPLNSSMPLLACCASVSHSIEIATHLLTNRIFPWIWCRTLNTLGAELWERNLIWKRERCRMEKFVLVIIECINAIVFIWVFIEYLLFC